MSPTGIADETCNNSKEPLIPDVGPSSLPMVPVWPLADTPKGPQTSSPSPEEADDLTQGIQLSLDEAFQHQKSRSQQRKDKKLQRKAAKPNTIKEEIGDNSPGGLEMVLKVLARTVPQSGSFEAGWKQAEELVQQVIGKAAAKDIFGSSDLKAQFKKACVIK